MISENTTIASFLEFFGETEGGLILRWQLSSDHKDRVKILEEALSNCYMRLVDARGLNKKLSEDQLSLQVVQMLNSSGIVATHDEYINGHCDIIVKGKNSFMWLAEAKVHSGYDWLKDGFLQLSTRYGAAMNGRDHGELIIYHRDGNSVSVLVEWLSRLTEAFNHVEILEQAIDTELFFRTSHVCKTSGCKFYVRHIIVPLQHNPQK